MSSKPFLKWAGGKQQLLSQLKQCLPQRFNHYYEPFVGSGALFFDLHPRNTTLSDINSELINCYIMVRDNIDKLIISLKKHRNDSAYFYEVRALDLKKLTKIDRASRFLFLNRTCFNGLYRENKNGQFNVPFGRYRNPDILQENRLRIAHSMLQGVEILKGTYKISLEKAKKGDFIYLDPPYYPLGGCSDFKRYNKVFFEKEDHEELAGLFATLDRKGCYIMLSNSDTPFTRSLYNRWGVKTILARRQINSDASKRGKITELLITNYEPALHN